MRTEEHLNKPPQTQSDVVRYLRHIIQAAGLELEFNIESEPAPNASPRWVIRFTGADIPMLTANDSKLLNALGHLIVENFGFAEVRADVSSIILAGARAPIAGSPSL
jgi:predicted RNA-binding protein Jag